MFEFAKKVLVDLGVIDGYHDVPTVDSAVNLQMRDVVGNKSDTHDGDSLAARAHTVDEHIHKAGQVYPTLANPILLTKGSGAWAAFPTPTEIVPAGGINEDFDIHWINVSSISANGNYEIALYSGGAGSEVEICRIPTSRTTVQSQEGSIPTQTEIIPADTRISAALSSGNAALDTVLIKLMYHRY
jgi:hypothetical protein